MPFIIFLQNDVGISQERQVMLDIYVVVLVIYFVAKRYSPLMLLFLWRQPRVIYNCIVVRSLNEVPIE